MSDQLVEKTTWRQSLKTDIHASGGIRTRNLSKRAAAGPRLRPCGHWDYLMLYEMCTKQTAVAFAVLEAKSLRACFLVHELVFSHDTATLPEKLTNFWSGIFCKHSIRIRISTCSLLDEKLSTGNTQKELLLLLLLSLLFSLQLFPKCPDITKFCLCVLETFQRVFYSIKFYF